MSAIRRARLWADLRSETWRWRLSLIGECRDDNLLYRREVIDSRGACRVTYQSTLEDGTTLVIRPIRPEDKPLLLDGFNRLSERSRYFRFFTKLPTLSDNQLHYLTEVDHK